MEIPCLTWSYLVPFHSGQVESFYLLVLGQVQMYKVNTILYLIFWFIIMSSHIALKTVWILKKPVDLVSYCLQNSGYLVSYCFWKSKLFNPKCANHNKSRLLFSSAEMLKKPLANSVDPDQTAPIGAVCSGSTLFASILNSSVMLGNYLQQTTSANNIFRCIFFLAL